MKKIKLQIFSEKVVEGTPSAYIPDFSKIIEREIEVDKIIKITERFRGQTTISLVDGTCLVLPKSKEEIESKIREATISTNI